MKAIRFKLLVVGITAFVLQSTWAELRIWTDEDGKTIEAEHVRTLTDQVVLRQADGTEIRVSLGTLSERDRKYAILQTPPKIDISVSTNMDRSNTGHGGRRSVQVQQESISVEVDIRKSSSPLYEAPLRAELYLIGIPEQKDRYVVLDKKVERFSFTADNDNQHTFESIDVSLKQLESGKQKGVEYKGYLVAVRDKTGAVISIKCSKLDYEKNAEAIMAGEKGTIFDADFEEVAQMEDIKKLNKPKKKKSVPGRQF